MATIKDIAEAAGVSVSTASRALNDNPRISLKTRQRVREIADQLGYQPNYNAQNLTRGESNMVGLIFPVTSDHRYGPGKPLPHRLDAGNQRDAKAAALRDGCGNRPDRRRTTGKREVDG